MACLLPILALLSGLAWSVSPEDALIPSARRIYDEGRQFEAQRDLERASIRYRSVLVLEPDWVQATLDLARVLEASGDPAAAEVAYLRFPQDLDAVEGLARMHLRHEQYREAHLQFVRFRNLDPGNPDRMPLEAMAVANLDGRAREAADVLDEFLGYVGAELSSHDAVGVPVIVARALVRDGDPVRARDVLATADERLEAEGVAADAPARLALAVLADRFEVEDEAARLSSARDAPLPAASRPELEGALSELADGNIDAAEPALRSLVERFPESAELWGWIARLELARGRPAEADRAALRAEQLDPLDWRNAARVGDILLEHFGGQHDAEAAAAFSRALTRPGAPPELWYRKGRADLGAGDVRRAIQAMERYVELEPNGSATIDATRFLEGARRRRLEAPGPPAGMGPPAGVDEEAWRSYWIAQVLVRHPRGSPEDLARAKEEIDPVTTRLPGFVQGLNLRAQIAVLEGDLDAGRTLYEASLAQEPDQGSVQSVLASIHRQLGNPEAAEEALLQAARLRDPTALVDLAERDMGALRPWAAAERLDTYFASPMRSPSSATELEQRARALDTRVRRSFRAMQGAGLAAVALMVGLPLGWRARTRGGAPLRRLIEASPAVWPDVARVLSAIRHEVLKHHTTVLGSVADALERGDPSLAEWASDRLGGDRGAISRFRAHVRELERLGRVHGVRLNLRHRDPVLGPVIEAIERLSTLEPAMRAGQASAAAPLREIADTLNHQGYRAIGALLRSLCLLPLTPGLLEEVWSDVRQELRSDVELELQPMERPLLIRIFRGELDDILTNLLRNALEASLAERIADEPARVGVRIASEDDPITGLERVAVRVRDNAAGRISTAMIRGRYIGRGLGLAVDLISRNGGSIHVEKEAGWAKAIVVRLPRAEAPDLEDDA